MTLILRIQNLTEGQARVVRMVAQGHTAERIAGTLGLSRRTVEGHIHTVADMIPNPLNLKPRTLVLLWAARRRWEEEQRHSA